MSQTDNKQAQQKYGRFHSVVTRIQRHPYISLAIPSSIFIFASLTHFLVNDKAIQTIFQVIVYIFGIIIGAILLLIADNHRKADYSRIKIGFLYGIVPLTLLGVAYFSKIIGDITAIIVGIASIVAQIALAYAKTGKSEESGIQKNVSKSSLEFIQGNSPTTIQGNSPTTIQENSPTAIQGNSSASIYNNSPISIQNNNNSPISIQNNVTNTQHVTNLIDEQSERERITTDAHKNLNAKDLPSRISAVKNLANVADYWLKDSPNCKKDEKKCQDIIDILCTYIRDSFPLAKNRRDIENSTSNRYTDADRQTLHDEQEVRRLIFEEISLRLSTLDENLNIHQGRWSKFKFNFSQAPIFYKMNGLTFEQLKTNTLKFFGDIDFQDSTFIDSFEFNKYLESNISFRGATFYSKADFSGSQFLGEADFSDVTFRKEADFQLSHFGNMNISLKNNKLDLNLPDFINQFASANFKNTEFRGEAIFYGTRFFKDAYFDEAIFKGNVDFTGSISKEDLSFKQSIFEKGVKFTDIRLVKNPNFKESLFSEDNLKGIICTSWNSEKFQFLSVKPGLIDVLTNNDINPQRNWPRNKLPAGARWFDPTSWNKAYKKYTRVSPPAR